ncbi:MAG: lipoprotein NlpI [Methanosaeta sp. PtaB.Bin087]|nr:MAG: lipoprotein NlpI [Methanosaeta sp. PtaB.Bin087]
MSKLDRHSSHPDVNVGDIYFNNNYIDAIKYYELAIQKDKNNLEALMGKGLALRELGKYLESIVSFQSYLGACREEYQKIDGYLEKGYTYICLGAFSDANECFDRCLDIDKKSPEALNAKGLVLYSMDAFRPAIQFYDKALGGRKDANFAFILTNRGNAWYELDMYDEALESYTRALTLNKNETGALIGKGVFYKKWGKYEEASKLYKAALDIDPNFVALNCMQNGISLHTKSKFDEAIKIYNKILALNSEYVISPQYISLVHINKGLALYSTGCYNEAIKCFNKALMTDSTYSILALIGSGAAQGKLKNMASAIECYNKAMDIDPNMEFTAVNEIIYMSGDESSFFSIYDEVLLSSILIDAKIKANCVINQLVDPDLEDIALNGYHKKVVSQEQLNEIKKCVSEVGIAGEEYINSYLQSLCENGKIKQFEWVSKNNAISPYDFYIININNERINVDVKSTNGEFDRLFHISYGELKTIVLGPERYDIYRVYELNNANAKLRIATDIRSFASGILEILKGLPEGVVADGVSVDTSLLKFEQEIMIQK